MGGDVTAISVKGAATGVTVAASDSAMVTVDGNVTASTYHGAATGVFVNDPAGYGLIHVGGDVTAYSHDGVAIGVKMIADSSIYVGGNATAVSILSDATAVYGNSGGTLSIDVGGNVVAYAKSGNATGISRVPTAHSTPVWTAM